MVQDRLFYAESFAQVVSLDTENEHRLSNPDTHSQHIPMLFDGSTIRLLASSHVLNAVDLEDFRSEYEIIANVWRMMKLRSPRRWLMDSRRIGMELEVSPGVMRAPLWQLCMSYEHDVREAAMDITRMQCLPLAEVLERVRNDPEHRMIHWVQLLMQPGHQRAISAPLSSSSSSSSAKRSAPASSNNQPSEVKALASKLDKLIPQEAKVWKDHAPREARGGKLPKAREQKAMRKVVAFRKARIPISKIW